jgi:hypothetical protein
MPIKIVIPAFDEEEQFLKSPVKRSLAEEGMQFGLVPDDFVAQNPAAATDFNHHARRDLEQALVRKLCPARSLAFVAVLELDANAIAVTAVSTAAVAS